MVKAGRRNYPTSVLNAAQGRAAFRHHDVRVGGSIPRAGQLQHFYRRRLTAGSRSGR